MKVIDFRTRKVIAEDTSSEPEPARPPKAARVAKAATAVAATAPPPGRRVPVLTFARGKFTLALDSDNHVLLVYNTATKVEIARRSAGLDSREEWVRWAEKVVKDWQAENS